ncbi:rhamnulokinase [Enterococcus gilvus]|uniref:Rhamnulokinase n=1 Tax=Enterococcus gilvus ATCC BAA-350 TaxID=1158614 RepID=R2V5U3_9ENTE|nr:rhamnulokinase [Enterococcus gilvus]EOI53051.1 rhamnulokinase [Enterococcus gilvus ATCC BAA-350]EOW77575.1 rhamnulokinase [Enterococcus gilvus ATCC BAA-350]OJG39080.1 rhamnulokinase [Enterococcus gilvus]
MEHYLAVDIGASSGRVLLSTLNDGKMSLTEIHRFKNGFSFRDGHDRWAIEELVTNIIKGLELAKEQYGVESCTLGIDTWAVDYCLIDKEGNLLADPIAYRDARTEYAVEKVSQEISLDELYERTGIQIQPFNTLFQLFVEDKTLLDKADKIALIPDYLGYRLTGNLVTEKTNASTTQLLNPGTLTWDVKLMQILGIDTSYFAPLVDAGNILGKLAKDQFPANDLPETTVITVATHDTASAVLGTPSNSTDNWAYLSSGTWSLLGVETKVARVSRKAFFENYTNEWGAHNTIRFLKNIMGMWLVQEVARMQNYQISYAEMAELAAKEPAFQQWIDINDQRFLNPENMIQEIQSYCRETNQTVPTSPGAIARCIYDNLALCYAVELEKLEAITGVEDIIDTLYIVGGGSNNTFLNQLTADVANIRVQAGPGEATAIGNLALQMITVGDCSSIEEARKIIKASFPCTEYHPRENQSTVLTNYKKFLKVRNY